MRRSAWIVACATALLVASAFAAAAAPTGEPTCEDLSGIDFGPCDAVLGYGVIDGDCAEVSGCESPVPLFPSLFDCLDACVGPTCEDLAGIDFGDCEAILGYGVLEGECQIIVGCESPVPLFPSQEACEQACAGIPVEKWSWGRVKARFGSE